MTVKRGNEVFAGYNKPKRTPGHATKSHAVLAKSGDEVKLIRFGQQGVKKDLVIRMLNLAFQQYRFFVHTHKTENRSAPAFAAEAPVDEPAPTDTLRLTLEQAVERALSSSNEMKVRVSDGEFEVKKY